MSDTVGFVREDGKPEGYVFGRPTKYRPEMCEQVIELGKEGAGKAEMAAAIGIGYPTFKEWIRKDGEYFNPDFSAAVNIAVGYAQAWWEKNGRAATFKSEGFNATSYIFNMTNRFGDDWKHKSEQTVQGPNGGPISHEVTQVQRVIVDPDNPDA